MNPFESFMRFVFLFTLFISVSLSLTIAVSHFAEKKDRAEQTAAALKAMLGEVHRE